MDVSAKIAPKLHSVLTEIVGAFGQEVTIVEPHEAQTAPTEPWVTASDLLTFGVVAFALLGVNWWAISMGATGLGVIRSILGLAAMFAALGIWGYRRNRRTVEAAYVSSHRLATSLPGYILYLRSFESDQSNSDLGTSVFEQSVAQRYSAKFPVVAIDNTVKPGITGGVLRVRTSHRVWRTVVAKVSKEATIVLIDITVPTPGLVEEIETHLSNDGSRCDFVIFINRAPNEDLRFRLHEVFMGIAKSKGFQISNTETSDSVPTLYSLDAGALVQHCDDPFARIFDTLDELVRSAHEKTLLQQKQGNSLSDEVGSARENPYRLY